MKHPLHAVSVLPVIAVLAALMSGCATPPEKPAQETRGDYSYTKIYLSWLIPREMRRAEIPGLSIALVDDQRVLWSRGFGYADAERGIPANAQTIYGIGSVTKLFTATAVMQLAEQGRIDLDAPLTRYVPEFSVRARFADATPITPRHLLTHHSGLPGDYLKGMWTLHPAPFEQVVPLLKQDYASYPPNLVYSYSSLGYSLLGRAIENVSGQKYASYMNNAVLAPLGMTDSTFGVDPERVPRLTVGYRQGKPGAERYFLRDVPAGALFSSAADMTRFIRMSLADGQAEARSIVRPGTLREMWRAQNSSVALDMDYRIGLGWMLGQSGLDYAGPVVRHNGGTLGTASELMLLPQHKLGVIVLANSAAASAALNRIAVQALKLALEAKTGIQEPAAPKPVVRAPASVSPDDLAKLSGNYASNFGVVFPVVKKETYLQTEFQGKTLALLPQADAMFGVQYRLFGWLPIDIPALRQVALSSHHIADRDVIAIHYQGKRFLAGMHMTPHPVPQAWVQRVGHYTIANQGEDGTLIENLQLAYENAVLVVRYSLPEAPGFESGIALAPISDTQAISQGLGRLMGETFSVVTVHGEERLLYSGYELRRVAAAQHD
jgi:CubicO group peptidase (beta-lactamase class C family)